MTHKKASPDSLNDSIHESFLAESEIGSRVLGLPGPWPVIYQEAMRGNHILFHDIDLFTTPDSEAEDAGQISEEESEELASIALALLRAPDLSTARSIVSPLPKLAVRRLFRVYQVMLAGWRSKVKKSLH